METKVKIKRGLIPLIFLFLISFSVYSAPPFLLQNSELTNTINIVYPKNIYHELNKELELNFHLFNYTGFPITNTSAYCDFHLYNNLGDHILVTRLRGNTNGFDFEFKNSTVTDRLGIYPYIIQCNKSNALYGYLSAELEVTPDGLEWNRSLNWCIIFGYFIILIAILFLIHTFKDHRGAPFVYGVFISTLSYIMGAMLLINKFWVFNSIFYNRSLALLIIVIGVYCTYVSFNFYQDYKPSGDQ